MNNIFLSYVVISLDQECLNLWKLILRDSWVKISISDFMALPINEFLYFSSIRLHTAQEQIFIQLG